jgi:hypothetical protein
MLHIHNGESTANTLREFGLPGEHFAFQEVLMAGPAPSGLSQEQWRETRAKYLSEAYDLDVEECRSNFIKQEAVLEKFVDHDETILWFEHDLFCQINLIYLLNWFASQSAGRTRLKHICIDAFPGIEDFRGLGQLTGEQLATLFEGRQPVTEEQFSTATQAWAAYCSADPRDIAHLLDDDTSALPFLRNALLLHLARFPSTSNGLGRIENKALELISHGFVEFKPLFSTFGNEEPVYGLGDSQFWNDLKRLAETKEPLITISGDERQSNGFHHASVELTATGRDVLEGKRDFININGIDLWLGGVHLDGTVLWRRDDHNHLTRHEDRSRKK